ncbi:MAG: cation-translocating P-type ATPase C-terminal domain-containing protein, partial [Coriobacteriia bacterium]|nr:cation-translocating P-type ATPase C-terminal domain-containing protein [Coriobacteriia bacterium]
ELVIDPTCSIVLERQPAEDDIMRRPPRQPTSRLLDARTLLKSVCQGLTIFAASFGVYLFMLAGGKGDDDVARSMGLAVIMLANLLLIQVNSSDRASIFHSIRRLATDWVMWLVIVAVIAGLLLVLYSPLNVYLRLAPLTSEQLLLVLGLACLSVLWYELVKLVKRLRA